MPITVRIDKFEDLKVHEQFGVPWRMTRRAYVSGLTEKSYKALKEAGGAEATAAGLPSYGDTLPGYIYLVLTEREFTLRDQDKATVDLVYEHINTEGQNLSNPALMHTVGSMQASIQQMRSNKDENGNMIVLEHTFAGDDQDPYYRGKTIKQTGEIEDFVPQRVFDLDGIVETNKPYDLAAQIVGAVNSAEWAGEAKRTWMCTEARWKFVSYGAHHFHFQFQHNPDTWDTTAVFIDSRTGLPPVGLVKDKGYKTIKKKDEVDFDSMIGTQLWTGGSSGASEAAETIQKVFVEATAYALAQDAAAAMGVTVGKAISDIVISALDESGQ